MIQLCEPVWRLWVAPRKCGWSLCGVTKSQYLISVLYPLSSDCGRFYGVGAQRTQFFVLRNYSWWIQGTLWDAGA